MKTIEIKIPVCNCGCEGDILVQFSDGILDFMVCNVCGNKLEPPNKVVEDGQAKWCPLFEECEFRQERGCDMKCRYYYPPAT